jgi:DNA-binding response OmpR family regulator
VAIGRRWQLTTEMPSQNAAFITKEFNVEEKFKRVNILIRPDQHKKVVESGLSLSGLVRDLLTDRFNNNKITLSMSRKSRKLYDIIVSNFGAGDEELEHFFVEALDRFLQARSQEIDKLRDQLQEIKDGEEEEESEQASVDEG